MRIPVKFMKTTDKYDRLNTRFTVFFHTENGCRMYTFDNSRDAYTRYRLGVNAPKVSAVTMEMLTQTRSYIVKRSTCFSRHRGYDSPVRKHVTIYDCNAGKHLMSESKRPTE